jgi:hypothetical protein
MAQFLMEAEMINEFNIVLLLSQITGEWFKTDDKCQQHADKELGMGSPI